MMTMRSPPRPNAATSHDLKRIVHSVSRPRRDRTSGEDGRLRQLSRAVGALLRLPRKLVRIVGEERVDAEIVKEVSHLVADRFVVRLLVAAERPRRHRQ